MGWESIGSPVVTSSLVRPSETGSNPAPLILLGEGKTS